MITKNGTHGLDRKTYALIKQLLQIKKMTPKKFSEVDETYLQMLLRREITYA